MNNPKNCPHCGSSVETWTTDKETGIKCTLCPASMTHDGSLSALIAMWNTRVKSKPSREDLTDNTFMGYKHDALRDAFNVIANPKNPKGPIDAVINRCDFDLFNAAAIFVASSRLEMVRVRPKGKVRVIGAGYHACMGA